MALYRCSICGSSNVVKSEQKDGFSYKKAIVGTVVLGAVGAVAGIDGKKTNVFSCSECGSTLPHPMDDITKTKIDYVMMNPDVLMPTMFPDMYQRYPALKKECELKHSAQNAEALAQMKGMLSNKQNPLNVSEEEFRQSAKEVAEALRLAKHYSSYYMPNFITAKEFHDGDKADINDIIFIRQSLGKMKNVVYALSCYSHLIHNAEELNTGLSRKEVKELLFTYVLMEHQDIAAQDLYYVINDNATLKQAFMLVMDDVDGYVEDVNIAKQGRHKYASLYSIESLEIIAWYTHLDMCVEYTIAHHDPRREYFDTVHFSIRNLKNALERERNFYFKCRIGVFDNKLHILSVWNNKNEENLPPERVTILEDIKAQIKATEEKLANAQELYKQLEKDAPTTNEINTTQQLQSLENTHSLNQATIQKLQKVKLFGKKKAQAEAEALISENTKLSSQIGTLKKELEKLQYERKKNNKQAKEEAQYEQEHLNDALEDLKMKRTEIIQDIHWVCVE